MNKCPSLGFYSFFDKGDAFSLVSKNQFQLCLAPMGFGYKLQGNLYETPSRHLTEIQNHSENQMNSIFFIRKAVA